MLLLHWRPKVSFSKGPTFLLLLSLVGLLRMGWWRLLNLWSTLLHLLNLLMGWLQDRSGWGQYICIVNDLALFILVPPHVGAQDVVVPEDAEADGALGVLLLKLSNLLGRDVAVGLDQMLVE